jgi:hypothetical protein
MIEGSGSGSIPLTGSGRPKNMWIRIRIRNTGHKLFYVYSYTIGQSISGTVRISLVLKSAIKRPWTGILVFNNRNWTSSLTERKMIMHSTVYTAGLRIRSQGSGAFLTPGSEVRDPKYIFSGSRTSEPGSRIPDPNQYFWELSGNFLDKEYYIFLWIGSDFFLYLFKNKSNLIVSYLWLQKKVGQ